MDEKPCRLSSAFIPPPSALFRLVSAAGLVAGAVWLAVAATRLFYPYDLDFIEDGLLMTALRFAQNQPVFVAPNAVFVPHVYMPLYPWLGGLLFRLSGPGFLPLRLLSLAATLTTATVLFWVARRESGQVWPAVAAAGLLLAGYRVNGFVYELARVDALFAALVTVGLAVGVCGRQSPPRLALSGAVLALAFWTKQTGLVLAVVWGGYLLLRQGRQSWPFWLVFGLLTLPPFVLVDRLTGGWFWYYTVHIAGLNPVEFGRVVHFLTAELFGVMGGLTGLALLAAVLAWRQSGWRGVWDQPWFVLQAAGILVSGMGRASVGGNINNRLAAYTLLCLSPALVWQTAGIDRRLRRDGRLCIVTGLVLVQFWLGVYNPWRYVVNLTMRNSGDALAEKIAAVDGEVLVMMHPYYALRAGKTPSAQIAALWHARERGQQPLPSDLVDRLSSGYYRVVISDKTLFETGPELRRLLETFYTPVEILPPALSPPTVAGMPARPRVVWEAK